MDCQLTVCICTYNGGKRIGKVLDSLQQQININFDWELIIVDNNSTDETKQIIKKYKNNSLKGVPLKYCIEKKQGLAYARRCGIREAQGDLIAFLDDDNIPSHDWVFQVFKFGMEHPQAGAYGGQIHGKFEEEPPQGFDSIARYYALITGNKTYCYNEKYKNTRKKLFPPGAGIVVRKKAWQKSVPDKQNIIGVSGESLDSKSEDVEFLSYIFYDAWELWFNHKMLIYHVIPKSRFSREYIMEFFKGIGLSRHWTRMIAFKPWQRPIVTVLYLVNDFLKLIFYWFKYRNKLDVDLVIAGKMQLLKYIFLSPFRQKQIS